jgi:protein phosphatase
MKRQGREMASSGTIEFAGIRAAFGSLPGTKAGDNQDAAIRPAAPDGVICAVADGVGSTPGAAAAAQAAVQTMLDTYLGGSGRASAAALRTAVVCAHDAVREATADAHGVVTGATTLVAAVIEDSGLLVANAGDSRAYAFGGDGELEQITADHSWVEEQVQAGLLERERAAEHPWRSVITRYLGGDEAPEVDVFERTLAPNSGVLLCSDGLMGALSEAEVTSALALGDPEAAVDALLRMAEERHAHDDVTVCIAQLMPAPEGHTP